MDVKVIGLPAADRVLIGKSVNGLTTSKGEVGRYVEDILEEEGKYRINRQNTVDIPELDMEIKTRDINSTAAHTIGSMSVEDILKTPYVDSPICKKLQKQYRVKHNGETIVSTSVDDFSDGYIQQRLGDAYEYGKELMAEGKFDQLGKGPLTRWGYWEACHNSASYKFRVRDKAMKGMEQMQHSNFKNIFEDQ